MSDAAEPLQDGQSDAQSMATPISQAAGNPYVVARRRSGDDFNTGMVLLRLILRSRGEKIFDHNISLPDMAFIVLAISKEIEESAKLIEGFGNFHLLMSDKSHEVLLRYLDSAVSDLTAARKILATTPRKSPAPRTKGASGPVAASTPASRAKPKPRTTKPG